MKKKTFIAILATLISMNIANARQIVDKTNKFYINLPNRYLLEKSPTTDNKFVVLEAYDPNDDSNFTVKISPSEAREIRGTSLDSERSKFRNNLQDMGLEPYVEGILHIAPDHESIYTFSRVEDQGEVLNYLIAKFWAHNKEYAFFCIQPTKTLRTQEFIDTIDSFICMQHDGVSLPFPEKKERPLYDKAKNEYDNLIKKTHLETEKLKSEGKEEAAAKILAALPTFEEKPVEYIPRVEINNGKPLPENITDKTARDILFSEEPEKILTGAKKNFAKEQKETVTKIAETLTKTTQKETTKEIIPPERENKTELPSEKENTTAKEPPAPATVRNTPTPNSRVYVLPANPKTETEKETPKDNQNDSPSKRITIIRNGKTVQSNVAPVQKELTKEQKKEIKELQKEERKEQKRQAKERLKELEKQRKEIERELKSRR